MAESVAEPNLRASKWYHWVVLARRSLTVLERMPEVDPQRLGIFGISVGGSLVWYVAGTDDRVKATCAIYGCGWNTHPKSIYADDPDKDDPSTILWRKTMEPEVLRAADHSAAAVSRRHQRSPRQDGLGV